MCDGDVYLDVHLHNIQGDSFQQKRGNVTSASVNVEFAGLAPEH